MVDFPMLLIAHGELIDFYGPVLAHAHTARQIVQRALQGELGTVSDAALAWLPARLRALPWNDGSAAGRHRFAQCLH